MNSMITSLPDIHNVIMPIGDKFTEYFKNNIDNLFENLIINNNQIFNSYIFNHFTYMNKDSDFEKNTIDIILKHLRSYLRKQKNFFRENNKKNKFNLSNINDFIDSFYKLVMKINNLAMHFKSNNYVKNLQWGTSIIINSSFMELYNIILSDMIVDIAISKNIDEHVNIKRNNDKIRMHAR